MTLAGCILKQVSSMDKYPSPPPEIKLRKKKKRSTNKYEHVKCKVDTKPPLYKPMTPEFKLSNYRHQVENIDFENIRLLLAMKDTHYTRGKVDSHWDHPPHHLKLYYQNRVNFHKKTMAYNRILYKRLVNAVPRVDTTASLQKDWCRNRKEMIDRAQTEFILFPPVFVEDIEDAAFKAPEGVTRPRVQIRLRFVDGVDLGSLRLELFTDVCPETCKLFLELLDGDEVGYSYVGTQFFSNKMLVPENGIMGATNEILLKIVSPEGQTFTAFFPEDTLVEEVKNRAVDYFYPNGESGPSRFKIVRVSDTATLHDFLTLAQEDVITPEELLLIERRIPEPGALWDLGAVRAPQPNAIAAATSSLPSPQNAIQQPNLQSLLSTNELSFELRKILISLIEAGARLAAAGRNYELTLAQLSAALDEPQRSQRTANHVITPEIIARRLEADQSSLSSSIIEDGDEPFRRAAHLDRFLEKFRQWRIKIAEAPTPESIAALKELGFSEEDADKALRKTGSNVPAAASWLIGERGSSVFELINGLPDGHILETLLKQPQIQRGLLNSRMLIAFIAMVGQTGSASLWLNSPHGSPLLSQISRTYHSEKYCLAVNQFSMEREQRATASTSRWRS